MRVIIKNYRFIVLLFYYQNEPNTLFVHIISIKNISFRHSKFDITRIGYNRVNNGLPFE